MQIRYAGLIKDKMKSGNIRYRVRVEGDPNKRIRLNILPDHKDFIEHYHAARRGIELKSTTAPIQSVVKGSISWLTYKQLEWLEDRVQSGLSSPKTLKKRQLLFRKLREKYGEYSIDMPTSALIEFRDSMRETPSFADSMIEAIRVMYEWAIERDVCSSNPAIGVKRIHKSKGGAVPWTVDDLRQFRNTHPFGTSAHLCLTLFMFTACRISDAPILGRANEFERGGIKGLGWQPVKKGSAYVQIPMMIPLQNAIKSMKVQGETYMLTDRGKPFRSPDALGQRFRKWCKEAGLTNRSSHGIRKAAGHLLAQEGCTQYQIMSIHGHNEAKTSEIYTKGVERWSMAVDAMQSLKGMEW